MSRFKCKTVRSRPALLIPLASVIVCLLGGQLARAGTITAVGSVTALTDRSQLVGGNEGRFDEGPTSGNVPLGLYSAQGMTFHTGALTAILPGVTTGGSASNPQYQPNNSGMFPAPIAGGGEHTGAHAWRAGVATFSRPVTQVGLTASRNGTQYLTVWDVNGVMLGQVTWVPANDSAFVGIDTGGVRIGMVAYGNDDLWGGASYNTSGASIYSDTWVWGGPVTQFCGNGVVDPGEVCDDGNAVAGDGCSMDCQSDETCGNGIVDGAVGEECDDGNTTANDGCSATCRIEYCGDGVVQTGETCDDGNVVAGDGCSMDCQSDETCGNGYVDGAVGEACDDGNTTNGDGCQANCALPNCGDNVVDAGEACDDGNNTNGDGCNATCTSNETCGNSIVDGPVGEQCDDGNTTANDGCSATCRVEYCGDGVVQTGEICDDGNNVSGDNCSADCDSNETCGNGYVDTTVGEACDDGNTAAGDGCSASCELEFCGNGTVDASEVCDDGNAVAGDGCSQDCMSNETCGNSIVDGAVGEECDDGNTTAGDGCSPTCQVEFGFCGDGSVDTGEVCDDGNAIAGDGCSQDCQSDETCGNGIIDAAAGEACDDGNTTDGDGCQADCALPTCGDGVVDTGEVCDDGNRAGGDGCNATCTSDETCGNGVVDLDAGEGCDDGNTTAGDGCSATCLVEFCGNGSVDGGEVCDDGNNLSGDGCSGDCQSDETCGNGYVDVAAGEECDDGVDNNDENGPCTTTCTDYETTSSSSSGGGCGCATVGATRTDGLMAFLLLCFVLLGLCWRYRR